ncbi:hypothetical protein phiA019_0008 [Aeromonas phage phiA019]|nr:hypothetical protein phiA009_0012 [Aeromonas phage phiA009]ULG01545.1 hypothetical protein phiA019_0008 [Aeromonas phage phiA019]
MNERVYYTIKGLVHKVIDNIGNFEIIWEGDARHLSKRTGIKDTMVDFEILESDFNTYWFKPVFNLLYDKIADYHNIKYVKSLQEQRALRRKGYEEYLRIPNKEDQVDEFKV